MVGARVGVSNRSAVECVRVCTCLHVCVHVCENVRVQWRVHVCAWFLATSLSPSCIRTHTWNLSPARVKVPHQAPSPPCQTVHAIDEGQTEQELAGTSLVFLSFQRISVSYSICWRHLPRLILLSFGEVAFASVCVHGDTQSVFWKSAKACGQRRRTPWTPHVSDR